MPARGSRAHERGGRPPALTLGHCVQSEGFLVLQEPVLGTADGKSWSSQRSTSDSCNVHEQGGGAAPPEVVGLPQTEGRRQRHGSPVGPLSGVVFAHAKPRRARHLRRIGRYGGRLWGAISTGRLVSRPSGASSQSTELGVRTGLVDALPGHCRRRMAGMACPACITDTAGAMGRPARPQRGLVTALLRTSPAERGTARHLATPRPCDRHSGVLLQGSDCCRCSVLALYRMGRLRGLPECRLLVPQSLVVCPTNGFTLAGRGIPPAGVAPRSNTAGMPPRRALPAGMQRWSKAAGSCHGLPGSGACRRTVLGPSRG